jgi:hypothetical protein
MEEEIAKKDGDRRDADMFKMHGSAGDFSERGEIRIVDVRLFCSHA